MHEGGVPVSFKPDSHASTSSFVGVEKCIDLLNGKSDEEKFAGLLLVTKTVKADDAEAMGKVLSAVTLTFIYRLLVSSQNVTDDKDASNLYQLMALNVLSSFCTFPELVRKIQADKAFFRMAKPLVDLLGGRIGGQDLDNLLRCLFCMATTTEGQRVLCQCDAAQQMLKVLQEQENAEIRDSVTKVLDHLLVPTLDPDAVAKTVPVLAKTFNSCRGMGKIDLLPRLASVLSCDDDTFTQCLLAQDDTWHADVRAGLMELLRNKLGGNYRVNIMRVALFMCEKCGQEWAVPAPGNTKEEEGGGVDGTFVQLLIAFCKLDLRLRLEEKFKPDDNDQAVPVELALLEKTLTFLTAGGEEEDEDEEEGEGNGDGSARVWYRMKPERLLYMRKDLEESMNAVLTYLEDSAEPGDPLVLAMSRVLCLWSLEVQSDLYTDRLCAVWPALVSARQEGAGRGGWALKWMLPALPVVLQEERVCDAFIRAGGPKGLAEMIQAEARATKMAGGGEEEEERELGGREEEAWEALHLALRREPRAASASPELFWELVTCAGGRGEEEEGLVWRVTVGMQVLRQLRVKEEWWAERGGEKVGGLIKAVARYGAAWAEAGAVECVTAAAGAVRRHGRVKAAMREHMEREGAGEGGGGTGKGQKAMAKLREAVREEGGGGQEEEEEREEEKKKWDGGAQQRRAVKEGEPLRYLTAEDKERAWAMRRDLAWQDLEQLRLREESQPPAQADLPVEEPPADLEELD